MHVVLLDSPKWFMYLPDQGGRYPAPCSQVARGVLLVPPRQATSACEPPAVQTPLVVAVLTVRMLAARAAPRVGDEPVVECDAALDGSRCTFGTICSDGAIFLIV
jgi:hypothetical protein